MKLLYLTRRDIIRISFRKNNHSFIVPFFQFSVFIISFFTKPLIRMAFVCLALRGRSKKLVSTAAQANNILAVEFFSQGIGNGAAPGTGFTDEHDGTRLR